jgi:hypothetical protein
MYVRLLASVFRINVPLRQVYNLLTLLSAKFLILEGELRPCVLLWTLCAPVSAPRDAFVQYLPLLTAPREDMPLPPFISRSICPCSLLLEKMCPCPLLSCSMCPCSLLLEEMCLGPLLSGCICPC